MNFQPRRFDRIDTSELAHDDGVSVMPSTRQLSHVATASAEDDDAGPMTAAAYFVGALIVGVIILIVYAAWRFV